MRLNRPMAGRVTRVALVAIAWVVAGALAAWLLALRSEIAAVDHPGPVAADARLVRAGAVLASLGSCAVCHTASGGRTFAGGRPLETPFGTLYSTNITPDPRTGIGKWSREAFHRAMRDGVSRDGRHLYPALPYEHFTKVSDADLDALYAFLMSRLPVDAPARRNDLLPPLGFRPLLAGWKLLFLNRERFVPDPARSAQWNRGAYIVDGLGHCAGCHSPRNVAGAEKRGVHAFTGGLADGWKAPALDPSNPQAATWDVDALHRYLSGGFDARHGVAAGSMGPVSHEFADVPEADVRAVAVFIDTVMHPNGAAQSPQPALPTQVDRDARAGAAHPAGAAIFAGACAGCHEPSSPMASHGRASLANLTGVHAGDPVNAVQAMLTGIASPADGVTPLMPGFGSSFTDEQIADVLHYVRERFSEQPAWPDLAGAAARIRKENGKTP